MLIDFSSKGPSCKKYSNPTTHAITMKNRMILKATFVTNLRVKNKRRTKEMIHIVFIFGVLLN